MSRAETALRKSQGWTSAVRTIQRSTSASSIWGASTIWASLAKSLELFNLLPAKSYVWTYTLLCGRIRELIVAKALDARGQGRELAATLKLQSWQVKNHLTWARRFSMAELVAALEGAVDVELALKGSADSQTALLLWITNILRKS